MVKWGVKRRKGKEEKGKKEGEMGK